MEKTKSEQEIKKIIEDYYKSGLSIAKFCKERKLIRPTFYSWLKKYKISKKDKLNFVSLSVDGVIPEKRSPHNPKIPEKIILKTQSGIEVELPFSISTNWLTSLLKELA